MCSRVNGATSSNWCQVQEGVKQFATGSFGLAKRAAQTVAEGASKAAHKTVEIAKPIFSSGKEAAGKGVEAAKKFGQAHPKSIIAVVLTFGIAVGVMTTIFAIYHLATRKQPDPAAAGGAAGQAAGGVAGQVAGQVAGERAGLVAGAIAGREVGGPAGQAAGAAAGVAAGQAAGQAAGERAGERAGEVAGEAAGERAGEVAR